jgi:hypothetical protein
MSMISFRRRAARLKSEARKREKEQHDIRETPEQKKSSAKAAPKTVAAPPPPPPVAQVPVKEEPQPEDNKTKVRKDS